MTQFLGVMLDPFVDGRGGVGAAAGGAAIGFAPERPQMPDDIALRLRQGDEGAALQGRAPAFEQRWSVWGAAYGGYNKTQRRSGGGRQPRSAPRAPAASRPASTIASRPARWWASRSRAAAPTGASRNGLGGGQQRRVAGRRLRQRRARGRLYVAAALAYARHWTSRPTASPSRAITSPPTSMRRASAAGSRAATASARPLCIRAAAR